MHMQRALHRVLLIQLLTTACGAPRQDAQTFRLVRVIRIPTQFLDDSLARAIMQHPDKLTLTLGGEDELPQGPVSFDVADDGAFVVSDPLRDRLVFYDSLGAYLEEWSIGFAATSVTFVQGGNTVEATSAITDERYAATRSSGVRRLPNARGLPQGLPYTATLDRGNNQGRVSIAGVRGTSEDIVVTPDDDARLVSLEPVGTDDQGRTFVALETTQGGERVSVKREVRAYGQDGRVVGQTDTLTTEYFVYPEDVFRVKGAKLYQLVPREGEVLIYVWDTTGSP
jgi:hypothetical protein